MDKVKISDEELRNLHEKGANLDPSEFDLSKISNSGLHSGEVEDQSVSTAPNYNLENIANSGRYIADLLED